MGRPRAVSSSSDVSGTQGSVEAQSSESTDKSNESSSNEAIEKVTQLSLDSSTDDGELTGTSEVEASASNVCQPYTVMRILLRLFIGLSALYVFLLGLELFTFAFKLFGADVARAMLEEVRNPIAGLVVGILATVLVQSSSTSTSMIVALVAADALTLRAAIPVVMGANIGTTITNTLVSFGHISDRQEFARAFGGAMVHDFFNLLCVALFLPLEVITHFLEASSELAANSIVQGDVTFGSPISAIVKPVAGLVLSVNKTAIVNNDKENFIKGGMFHNSGIASWGVGLIVLIIALIMLVGGLLALVRLLRSILSEKVQGWISRFATGSASNSKWFPYASIVVGIGLTVMVQSSSVVTSALTPLVGVGVISLEQMYPVTLGSNIGTTGTAMLAAVASGKTESVSLAFAHLFFNICGILVWFPVPWFRSVPLWCARNLADAASYRRWVAPFYVGVVFIALPISLWLLSLTPPVVFYIFFSIILLLIVLFVTWAVLKVRQPNWLASTYSWPKIGRAFEYLFERLFVLPDVESDAVFELWSHSSSDFEGAMGEVELRISESDDNSGSADCECSV